MDFHDFSYEILCVEKIRSRPRENLCVDKIGSRPAVRRDISLENDTIFKQGPI